MNEIPWVIPGRYPNEIAVMQEMGWSWSDLLDAPADLVDEILTRLAAQSEMTLKRRQMSR
jgi:hypothetical protein